MRITKKKDSWDEQRSRSKPQMTASRKHSESGARPSNAGDRYHLVYVARRLLDLLHPYSRLTQLVIENVSPADEAAQRNPTAFLGVDVAEYYGGEDVATSDAVNLVQVKYSPLRPTEPWTRSRLTAMKDGGESVFRKLAAMFDALAPSADSPAPRARVTIHLLTNQPLGIQLRQDLETLREAIESKSPLAAGRALAAVRDRAGESARALQVASGLSWTRFSELLAAWDLDSFQQPSIFRSEAELFEALSGFNRNGSERLEVLLSHLQMRATPGQRETIRRRDALAFLRLTEDDLYPAPTVFQEGASLFETRSSSTILQTLEKGVGLVVVHGRSGAGKTSALRLALRNHGGGGKAVLYDCFADGRGLLPGAERFPYKKCFTQVINELDARYRTGVLATVGLEYQGLLHQLDRALKAAASAAEQEGHRLALAFDAIDNAIEQQRRAPPDAGTSFVPLLWKIDLPSNCTLVVSLRSENLAEVVGDNAPNAKIVEVTGFDGEETRLHAVRHAPSLPTEEVSFLHERTAGNPRVQSKVLEDIASSPPELSHQIIEDTARRTAFDYYDQESERRLALPDVRRVLAVLYEMRQAPKLADVSAITGLTEQELRGIVGRLTFGLRLDPGDRVAWQDQDFLDWTGERLRPEREVARAALAEHCLQRFRQDEYARWNLSHHLLQAGQFDRLVAWWREPGRLGEQILAAHPHEERVLDDLRAALIGALRIGQTREAFDLLLRAADIAEGRDAFANALAEHPDVAVAADLAHLLPGGPSSQSSSAGTREQDTYPEARLNIAMELARWPERRQAAQEVYDRFCAEKEAERIRDPERRGGLSRTEFEAYAQYQARVSGFSAALRRLVGRATDFWTRLFALAVGADWRLAGESDPLGVLLGASLGTVECAAAALGILAVVDPDHPPGAALRSLAPTAVENAVGLVLRALPPVSADAALLKKESQEKKFTRRPDPVWITFGAAVENLTAAGFLDAARSLLAFWSPPKPRYRLRDELEPFLRCAALREALTGMPFESATYELPGQPSRSSAGPDDRRERELQEVRHELDRTYPPLLTRALAWAGAPPDEVLERICRLLASWRTNQIYVELRSEWGYQVKAAILLEAILALPGLHIQLVDEVIDTAENALGDSGWMAWAAGASVLSRDERYLAKAERLIRKELEHCRPPEVPAGEGMERLFHFYRPAARVDASLARRVIVAAREVASEIDSRIYARAEAVTTIAQAAQADLAPELLDGLCAVTRYWWSVDRESSRGPGERALALLARRDPGAAVNRAWELEKMGLLDFENGLGHVALGALAGRSLLPENIWPILPLFTYSTPLDAVARGSIEQLHERGLPVGAALSSYCRHARLYAAAGHPVQGAQEIVAWAESAGLGRHPEIQAMQAYVARLDAALAEHGPAGRPPEAEESESRSRHRVDPSPLFEMVSQQLSNAPRAALERLENAAGEDLRKLTDWEIGDLLPCFLETLPLVDRLRLAAVIERWGAGDNGTEALLLLDALLGDSGVDEPDLERAVTEAVRRLLTSDTLKLLASTYRSNKRAALFQGQWAPPTSRLQVILSAMAEHFRDLGSDTLFFLASQAANLLEPADLATVARDFIARTVAEAPALGDPAYPGKEPRLVIPHALTLALGHPRQALRWRGVYGVVHALVDTEKPESFLGPFLDALANTDLPRWLSVREWLAFALEHVSLRKPGILRSAVPLLLPHAVSHELPHAKIRHHLKQALLAVEESFPGTIDPEDLARLDQINQPIAVVPRKASAWPSLEWEDGEEEPAESGDVNRLTPGYMDTMRYWYQPLARCFVARGTEVPRTILRKATDWMAWLGVTRSAVEAEYRQVGSRYSAGGTYNDHGTQPQVELLRLYGERHGLYLVAGELIDSTPVVETRGSDCPPNEWDYWARYNLRGADPALPARLLDAPPPLADNYSVFSAASVEAWRKKEEPEAFSSELEVPGESGWIIVAGNREGFEDDRSFTASVHSALVSPRTSHALAKLLESGNRDAFLPSSELPYVCILPELEPELEHIQQRPGEAQGEYKQGDGRFVLNVWTVRLWQEAALHHLDPAWPSTGRHYELPTLDVVRQLGWTRHPTELVWRDATDQLVARCDLWRRSDGTGSRFSEGCRLVMRRDAVSAYAHEVGLDVIFAVRLSRQGRTEYRAGGENDYDLGTTRCFLWSDLTYADPSGEGLISMAQSRKTEPAPTAPGGFPQEDATLEERTRYLLQAIGEEAGFLEQWIVHYLAELLERANDQKAAPHARSEARTEIAKVIPFLWEQQIAREALHVRGRVDHWLRRSDTLDSEAEQLLCSLLTLPDKAVGLPERKRPDALRALHTLAEQVTRFFLMIASAKRSRREVTSEALRRFLQRDEEVQKLQATLARIVPDFSTLDTTDANAVNGLAHQTLISLTQAQLTLLTRRPAPPPREERKRAQKGPSQKLSLAKQHES